MSIFKRIALEFSCMMLLYGIGLYILARVPVMDLLLSPGGSGSVMLPALAAMFLTFRVFVLVCLPGWILARWYLLATAD